MVELFTSQGCNSCPPADHWMSHLVGRDGLWTSYVPLAFHVDYWDDIGWRDPFATPEHSRRQRRHAEEGGVGLVYTPGFILNGEEWRHWRGTTEPDHNGGDVGLLSVNIDSGKSVIQFAPPQVYESTLVATVATLGFGLESDIIAGENSGRKLINDFVVLGIDHASMYEKDGRYSAVIGVPKTNVQTTRQAFVVWISASDSLKPLQATGGWLPGIP